MGTEAIKHVIADVHKPGGVSLDMNGTPASTKGTISIKFVSLAKKANATKSKVLELKAESVAWCVLGTLSPLPLQKGSGEPRLL